MERHGKCLCGAVQYKATLKRTSFATCHCQMCRRWAGGPYMSTSAHVNWEGEEHIGIFTSSAWAERGFCKQCGSALFYRLQEGDETQLAVGTLDDASDLQMGVEWFIDNKPEGYTFEGKDDRKQFTQAEVMKMFGGQ